MNRTVTVPLNYNNILAQEEFGSGKGLSDVKIQYIFMDEILWVLDNERHCSGWICDLVRHFWLWIMTVGSKLNGYEYECNGGLHFELYRDDGKQTADIQCLNSHCNNWNWGTENMQFHRVAYCGEILFLIYNKPPTHS